MHYNAIYDAGAVGGGRYCANCKSPAGFNWQTQLRASSWSGFNLVAAAMNKWKVGLGQVFDTSAPLSLWRLDPTGLGKTQVLHATLKGTHSECSEILWNTHLANLKFSKQQTLWNTLEDLGKTLKDSVSAKKSEGGWAGCLFKAIFSSEVDSLNFTLELRSTRAVEMEAVVQR